MKTMTSSPRHHQPSKKPPTVQETSGLDVKVVRTLKAELRCTLLGLFHYQCRHLHASDTTLETAKQCTGSRVMNTQFRY